MFLFLLSHYERRWAEYYGRKFFDGWADCLEGVFSNEDVEKWRNDWYTDGYKAAQRFIGGE